MGDSTLPLATYRSQLQRMAWLPSASLSRFPGPIPSPSHSFPRLCGLYFPFLTARVLALLLRFVATMSLTVGTTGISHHKAMEKFWHPRHAGPPSVARLWSVIQLLLLRLCRLSQSGTRVQVTRLDLRALACLLHRLQIM